MYCILNLLQFSRFSFLLLFFVLGGCFSFGPEVAGYTKSHIWIKNPTYNFGDGIELAHRHCKKTGKIAELELDPIFP